MNDFTNEIFIILNYLLSLISHLDYVTLAVSFCVVNYPL